MDRPRHVQEIWYLSDCLLYNLQQGPLRGIMAIYHIGKANFFSFQVAHLGRKELLAYRAGNCWFCVGSKES